jgi:hypothetical protein
LRFVLVALAGWINQQQIDVIDYLQEENRALREQLGPSTQLVGDAAPVLMLTDPPYSVKYDAAWRYRRHPRQRTAVGAVLNDDRVDWTAAYRLFAGDVLYVWQP